ncbi:MAG: site-2 protease family protein [Gemmatimonadetes bacterium]|nr:site-2 protease family protein [Gemmatimonadota bacterium]
MQNFLLALPVLLFSMVAHEYAHGYAALRQGDQTALMLGRLTFNPIKHIDPWMTILLPALLWFGSGGRMMFGGAKPVPVNPRNYHNYKRGDIIVSSAGIVANLVLSVLFAVASVGIGVLGNAMGTAGGILGILQWMTLIGIWMNLLLAFFNLIPIPPLDGSHLFYHLLPPQLGARYRALSGYGLLLLPLLLFMLPGVFSILLFPARALFGLALRLVTPYTLQGLPSF